MEDIFDFIIVGAGASGSLLASRLARSRPQFSVLLIDAGGDNQDEAQQTFGERHTTLMTPGYNWGYKTLPQEQLKGRQIDYSRGKGLGGSTAINFCVYTRGPSADYEHWAQVVGDDTWRWEKVQKRFNKFERFHPPSKELDQFVRCSELSHGYDGEVDVGMTLKWDPTFGAFLDKTAEHHPRNYDHNSGNPLGIAVCQQSTHDGRRVTASGAFLSPRPENLHITTNTAVRKILFEGKRAVGVDIGAQKGENPMKQCTVNPLDAATVSARREVILSAGAIDSPKLLLLSGVGASNELQEFGIPITHDLPGVGKNLQDRLFLELVTVQKPGSHHRTSYSDSPAKLDEARKQWANDQTGPLTAYYLPQMIGYIRSDEILASKEFQRLSSTTQQGLRMETKPTYEIMSQSPSPSVKAPELYLASAVAFPATETGGEMTLQSSNPTDPPLINPKFLSHPFDRYLAIQSVRETLDFLQTPLLAREQERLAAGPKGREDDEILEYVRNTATSMWHACGTVKMGKPQDTDACVDTDFKVRGLEGLRVVDMSVAPFLPSAHTQAVAYLIAETASEKILAEHP